MLDQDPFIKIHENLVQGSDEWLAARCGILTASEMKRIVTPTLKAAKNADQRTHLYELLAQRVTRYVEPSFVGDDMLRGQQDEFEAVMIYHKEIAPVENVGFITNNKWGFTIGYSPDGIVGDKGLIEVKSRRQKYQAQTILDHVATGSADIPRDFVIQCQTGLMVSEREWLDFISYCGGMPMCVIRAYPDEEIQRGIQNAAYEFENALEKARQSYLATIQSAPRLFPTERKNYEEITL